jgi:hypothetical protein
MIKQEVLQNLFQVRRDLENRLMDLSPSGDLANAQLFQDLSRKRDQVFMTINQVLAADFNEVFDSKIDDLLTDLTSASTALQGMAKTFATVNDVISKVDTVLLGVQGIIAVAAKVALV